ncbi:hypothetical protein [Pseudomonas sp. PDM22]|uniref:hypothetical protein n=1 Tax=Pseudomonas sp. PDM22 TaxID=2769287 RepID=UPI00177CE501|nr:hypothetical protein [Pseudomonas sp. PDM22]MBD9513640.1 hypothetical protein [Pseudomonas sp. PDM22]
MGLFQSESEMQDWLSEELSNGDGLADVIVNIDCYDDYKPSGRMEQRILDSINVCKESLYSNVVVSENENISINEGEALKPDFVLYATETESIVIVELKNLVSPSRQAGTELSAYCCEIRASIPFISDGDVVNVLVSTEWSTLLKHYVRQEVFWQRKNLICLRPVLHEGVRRLEILPVQELAEGGLDMVISDRHLGGYQICLYDDGLYQPNANRDRLDGCIEQFKTALQSMATIGARLNSHGFAFLWKDEWELSLAPYSITVINFAPYQSIERFLQKIDLEDIPEMVSRFMDIVVEFDPVGHGNALSEIRDTATDILSNVCSVRPEGYTHWGELRSVMLGRDSKVAFVGWGLFGEAMLLKLKEEYRAGNTSCSMMDPEIGLSVVDSIVDRNYPFIELAWIKYKGDQDEEASDGFPDISPEEPF